MVIFAPKITSMFKSFYTTFYGLALIAGFIVTTLHFAENANSIGRFAAMLSYIIGILWFVYTFTLRLRNALFGALIVSISSATAFVITIGSQYVAGNGSLFSVRMALTALVLWLIFHVFASRMRKLDQRYSIGAQFPDVPLCDADGNERSLKSISGKKMLLFYRGKWCPFCVDQAKDYFEALDAFEANGVKVIGITTEEAKNSPSQSLFGLTDKEGRLGKELGIFRSRSLPLGFELFGFKKGQNDPLGVLVDENMMIIAVKKPSDNRERPTPQWFLRYLA